MYAQPAKKLLFMGGEIGQWKEWNHDAALDWHLLEHGPHAGLSHFVGELNGLYRRMPALHRLDCDPTGFEWIDASDSTQSTLCFLRRSGGEESPVVVALNFTPVPRHNFRLGVPDGGFWRELLNSDAKEFGGSGQGNLGGVTATPIAFHGRPCSLNLTLPPLGAVFLAKGEPE